MAEPGVYPRGAPRPTRSRAEQALHAALSKQLPCGWLLRAARHQALARAAVGCVIVATAPGHDADPRLSAQRRR